ncbi:helix-turn-helix domain-containing protein [Ruania halotolerans]|uniref:helix-turn-helix domain-containing protein n=1 Tax=Ruania halotolerans TaxID=2897773 RepID=UPI001E55FB1F|nr:helix-turn-helix transcriptional regulator [Ruania halotolerans]UFU07959.1 helix-turn-helix domain-containing protein [Ruania halotolerans]
MAIRGTVSSPESLGRILQQARLLAGLSQRQLANRMGVSQRYIWEMEAGKPSKYTDRLFAMMRETHMTLSASIETPDE